MGRTRRAFAGLFSCLMILGVTGIISGGASAEPTELYEREADAAQLVIDQLEAAGDDDISLDDINLGALGPPPWTSYVPNRDPKAVQVWLMLVERFPELRGAQPAVKAGTTIVVYDSETTEESGLNDTPELGQMIEGFGTGADDGRLARVIGSLFTPPCESQEDDGSIPLASPTSLDDFFNDLQFCTGFIGDGPNGETTGDFDFYSMNFIEEGRTVIVDVIQNFESEFEPATTTRLYDSAGTVLVEVNDSGDPDDFAVIEFVVPADDVYFAAVSGQGNVPSDPFDSASGNGATTTGLYDVVLGNFETFLPIEPDCGSIEDDGAIQLASPTDLDSSVEIQFCVGEIGDSQHESTGGDIDFYSMNTIEAGRTIIAEVIPHPDFFDEPATTVAIYDSAGNRLAEVDDSEETQRLVQVVAPATDTYFLAVSGAGNVPSNPADPSSGSGSESTGPYGVFIGNLEEPVPEFAARYWRNIDPPEEEEPPPVAEPDGPDVDMYLVDLEAGDVLSAGFEPFGVVEIYNPDGSLAIGSTSSASIAYPPGSPLRHLGSVGVDHVARTTGTYAVSITAGFGPYEGEIRVARSGRADDDGEDVQIIYLDFDGANLSPDLFDPFAGPGEEVPLSGLAEFLPAWGLAASDEDAVIDAVIAEVEYQLGDHLRDQTIFGNRDESGVPGEFDVEIRNSRDHGDLWGDENVSRVIVGGTIDELGIPTVGIAQSIDPGNLDSEESAVVLLDLLSSDPAVEGTVSLNTYEVAEPFTKADLVGTGVGLIVAHEVGHFVGNWHTETFNDVVTIMDAGGDLPGLLGVGPDFIFGNEDDEPVFFTTDMFNAFEGFFGDEDTEARTGFAMLTGPVADSSPASGSSVDRLAQHHKFGEADAQVLRLYVAFFNRQPDIGGANYWIGVRNDGSTLADIAGFFTLSEEFKNNYAGTTNEQYVAAVYTNVLGRDFDQGGFDYWLDLLETDQLDRGGVVQWISLNAEFVNGNLFGGH